MAKKNLRVHLFQPIERMIITGLPAILCGFGLGGFHFFDSMILRGLPIDLLKIEKAHAA